MIPPRFLAIPPKNPKEFDNATCTAIVSTLTTKRHIIYRISVEIEERPRPNTIVIIVRLRVTVDIINDDT